MDAHRWRHARRQFEFLVDLEDQAWAQRLAQLADTDPVLAQDVAELLAADAETGDAATELSDQAGELIENLLDSEEGAEHGQLQGQMLGCWRLEREIGRGGMGAVWLASRADGAYEGHVAIKLMHARFDGAVLRRRFQAERQILAGLDHPNIARLVDAGGDAEGRPFPALEYVDGQNIVDHCDARGLSLDQRLGIFYVERAEELS